MENPQNTRTGQILISAVALLLFLLLLYTIYNTISVFLGVFTFAVIFSVSFHGLFESLASRMGNRRKLAGFLYAVMVLVIIAMPFLYGVMVMARSLQSAQDFAENLQRHDIAELPAAVSSIPLVGPKLTAFWQQLEADPQGTLQMYHPQIKAAIGRLLHGGLGMAATGLELFLGVVISAVLLVLGGRAAHPLELVLAKLAGEEQAESMMDAAGRAIKGVAVGVMGTGFIAGIVAWIGYSIAGIGIAPVLAALTFFLVVIQIGPVVLILPATILMAVQGDTGSAVVLGIFTLILTAIDNVLKPYLIGRSGKLPILILFIGVAGGMAAWGITGMFKGAIVLSVGYTLFNVWFVKYQDNIKPGIGMHKEENG